MPNRKQHLQFDEILKTNKLITNDVQFKTVHDRLDRNVRRFGPAHREKDFFHTPEGIERFIENLISSLGKISSELANDYVKIAYGHFCLDKVATKFKRSLKTSYNKLEWKIVFDEALRLFYSNSYDQCVYSWRSVPCIKRIPNKPGFIGSGISLPYDGASGWANIYYTNFTKNDITDIHFHDDSDEYYYLEKGEIILYLDNEVHILVENDVAYIPKGFLHAVRSLTNSRLITIGIQKNLKNKNIQLNSDWEKNLDRLSKYFSNKPDSISKYKSRYLISLVTDPILEVRWRVQSLIVEFWENLNISKTVNNFLKKSLNDGSPEIVGAGLTLLFQISHKSRNSIIHDHNVIRFVSAHILSENGIIQWYAFDIVLYCHSYMYLDKSSLLAGFKSSSIVDYNYIVACCMISALGIIYKFDDFNYNLYIQKASEMYANIEKSILIDSFNVPRILALILINILSYFFLYFSGKTSEFNLWFGTVIVPILKEDITIDESHIDSFYDKTLGINLKYSHILSLFSKVLETSASSPSEDIFFNILNKITNLISTN